MPEGSKAEEAKQQNAHEAGELGTDAEIAD